MSPYPTVVNVTIAQYILIGMLVYPDFSPSIRYIKDPKTITIFNTAKKNINIQVISTSEIKISVLIDLKKKNSALRALHSAYKLDD